MDDEAPIDLVDDQFDDFSIDDAPIDDNESYYDPNADIEEEEVEPTSENFRAGNRYKPLQHNPRELPTINEEKDDGRSNTSSRLATRPPSALSNKSNDTSAQFGFQSGGHALEQFTEKFYSEENRAERLFPEGELVNKGYVSPIRDKQNSWEPSVCHYEKQPTPEKHNNSPGLIFANMGSRKEPIVKPNDENDPKVSPEKSTFATSPMNSSKYETKTSTPKRPGNTSRMGRGLPNFECSTIYESPQRSASPPRLFGSRQPTNTTGLLTSDTMLSNRTISESMIKRVLGGTKKDNDLLTALEQVRKRREQPTQKPDFRLNASKLSTSKAPPPPAIQRSQSLHNRSSSSSSAYAQSSSSSQDTQRPTVPQKRNSSSDLTSSNTTSSTSNLSRLSTAKTMDSTRLSRNRGGFSDSSVSTVVPKDRDGRDSVSSMRTVSRASSTMSVAPGAHLAQKPINICSKRLAFGVVPVDETLTMELEVENISDRQCQIRCKLDTSNPVVKLIDNKLTMIDPKKSMKIRVSFTPNSRGRYQLFLSVEVPAQNFLRKIPIWGIGGVARISPMGSTIQKSPNPSEFSLFLSTNRPISFKLCNNGDRDGFALMTVYDSSMKPIPNEYITYRPRRGVIVKKDSVKDVEIVIDPSYTEHHDDDYRTSSAMSSASSIRRRVSVGSDYVVQICWGEEVLRERLRWLDYRTGQPHHIDGLDFTSHMFYGENDVRKPPEATPTIVAEDVELFASSYRSLYLNVFSSTRDLFAFKETMKSSSGSGNDVTVLETTAFRHQTFVNDVTMMAKPQPPVKRY